MKRERLRPLLPTPPVNVRFVAIDFNREGLVDRLPAAGFDLTRPAAFVWEGVSNYLSEDAVDSVLRFVASTAPESCDFYHVAVARVASRS